MKQYRTLLLIFTFLLIGWIKLISQSGIEPTSFQGTPYKGGIMVGVIPIVDEFTNDTTYLYQHSDTSFVKIDSLVYTDSLRLYTSQGIFTTYISAGGGSGVTNIFTTLPITTSGGSTPTIAINTATGSTDGALTSSDWNTFNGKVGGSGTLNYIPKWSSSTGLTNSNIFDDGTNVGIAWGGSQKIGLGTLSPSVDIHAVGDYFRLNNGFKFSTDGGNSAEFSSPNDLYFYTDVAIGSAPSGTGVLNLAGNQIGIKDATPSYDLDINGTARVVSRTGTATQLLGTDASGKLVNTSASGMAINGTTAFTWDSPSTANMYFGDAGTGSGTIFWTPSLSSSFASGLAVDGSYASSISTVNLRAFGVKSGGPYRSELAFHTTSGTTMTERMRLLQDGAVQIGNLAGSGNRLVLTGSTGILSPVTLGTGLSFSGTTLNGPSIPETWANISNHIVSWGSTGTFGSGYPVAVGVTSATQDVDINGHIRLRGAIYSGATNSSGSIGQVLTSQGAGNPWIWSAPSAGAFTVAANGTAGTQVVTTDGSPVLNFNGSTNIEVTRSGDDFTFRQKSPYTLMSIGTYNQALTTTYTKMALSGQSSTNGDATDINFDNTNDEIDILTTGSYHISYKCNCKSNTASIAVIFDLLDNTTSGTLGAVTTHYFDNTNEFSHNNSEWIYPFVAGDKFSLYAKTASGTTTIQDCNIRMFAERIK